MHWTDRLHNAVLHPFTQFGAGTAMTLAMCLRGGMDGASLMAYFALVFLVLGVVLGWLGSGAWVDLEDYDG